jgi:cell division protein FtsZ
MTNSFQFELPSHHKSIIKVIGVGGGGSNAVNHMYSKGIKDVEFVISNTDLQALKSSPIPNKLQLGNRSLGAGANPDLGKVSAVESSDEIRDYLSDNTKMLFITAGMGGGTGTGAAPVIAKIAKEMDILTVGIVTVPFSFEGKRKTAQAENGIAEMRQYCDTVIVVVNDKLREVYGNLSLKEAFGKADDILLTAAKSIAEIITVDATMNIDFEDVRSIMKDSGAAVMGSGRASGENRATLAAEAAICSPLLNNTRVKGASKVLFSVSYGPDYALTMDELAEITDYITDNVAEDAFTIWGHTEDVALGDEVVVTVIATGYTDQTVQQEMEQRKVIDLETDRIIPKVIEPVSYVAEIKPVVNIVEAPSTPTINNELENSVSNEVNFEVESKIVIKDITPTPAPVVERVSEFNLFNNAEKNVSNHIELEQKSAYEEDLQRRVELLRERKDKLRGLSAGSSMSPEEFREMLEKPAYLRQQATLTELPHSSERQVSRLHLNEDNELLGNNRFLHDNVD